MSLILRLLSPFLFRILRRYVTDLSGLNQERFRQTRNRLVGALLSAVLGLLATMIGLFTAIIDAAVQYDQQGGVNFNVVMGVATGLVAVGVLGMIVAKLRWPSFDDFRAVARRADPKGSALTKRPRRPEYAH